ncbi:hypothetical protein FE810_08870 [Thalassotalea litorea]|uniref:Uncharacterized protein n=1 Tax=Thalassotalea litorea TaxID=2020715 RepID=A0A5R9ITX5_9GAMM|nr:hypothetical protein [Thalassotalea litorea]TLU65388.1 hypothetical protein FE810_08870 [Thalassotalea litorea]
MAITAPPVKVETSELAETAKTLEVYVNNPNDMVNNESEETQYRLPPGQNGGAAMFITGTDPLIGKQVCKNNVVVKYRVPDNSGYKAFHSSIVQVQGVVRGVTTSGEDLRISITGWYTLDSTLRGWRPYLEAPPLTEKYTLRQGNDIVDERAGWNPCVIEQPNLQS